MSSMVETLKRGLWVVLIAIVLYVSMQPKPEYVIQEQLLPSYDYVIIGGGTAGLVVAARLSENSNRTVLVLEAGGVPWNIDPVDFAAYQNTEQDWAYRTQPQKHACLGLKDRQSAWPRGKMLGGSSSLNAMVYARGSKHSFERWAELGAKGWSYEEILPYFIRSESNSNETLLQNGFHGNSGPLKISTAKVSPMADIWEEAARQLGYRVGGINGEQMEGFSRTQAFATGGARQSTARAYLKPISEGSGNLHVATGAHVTKIVFDGKQAAGAQFVRNNLPQKVEARKEVILSAGTIGSAQILMLSGVGPKAHLEDLGIPVIADLAVGDNLQDHLMTDYVRVTLEKPYSAFSARTGSNYEKLKMLLFGTGYRSFTGIKGIAFVRSAHQPKRDKREYIELLELSLLFGAMEPFLHGHIQEGWNTDDDVWQAMEDGLVSQEGITILAQLQVPKSRGTLRLRSANPFDHPLLDPNYLSEEQDGKVLLDAVRIAEKLVDTPAFRAVGAKLLKRVHPRCKHEKLYSDAYVLCYIRHQTWTIFHQAGTCKMGAADDPTAVVDPELRVRGLAGLRVVDASIMPEIVNTHTAAAIIAIAEKAADMIKQEDNFIASLN